MELALPEVRRHAEQPHVTCGLTFAQWWLGLGATLAIALPYLRRTHGLERLRASERYLFVCNHVSLLDTLMLGALCWRSGCYPILVLGDKNVWHASWLKRFLSSRIGFLLERGKLNPNRIRELQAFGRAGSEFHLVVFPEGTRGDGINVAACQPGIYYIAQEARMPLVPVFFENMQLVSTKTGRFHPISGLRKVEVHFGEPIPPERYLALSREEFLECVRNSIIAAGQALLRAQPRETMDLVRVLATLRDETIEFDWDDAWEKLNAIDATLRSELPLLRGALGDSSALLRLFALKAIARVGGDLDELIPDVVVLLKDRDQDVRAEATKLLRRFGHNRTSLVIPALCQLAKDKNGYLTVRLQALIAVFKLKLHSRHG